MVCHVWTEGVTEWGGDLTTFILYALHSFANCNCTLLKFFEKSLYFG